MLGISIAYISAYDGIKCKCSNLFLIHIYPNSISKTVNMVDGELLKINKVSRLHMAAYLCVAANGVPPSISKRIQLRVQCKWTMFGRDKVTEV